jgi:hypothetical protein
MTECQHHPRVHAEDETYGDRCDIANEHVQQDDEEETESSSFTPGSLSVHFGERKRTAAVDYCV